MVFLRIGILHIRQRCKMKHFKPTELKDFVYGKNDKAGNIS